MKFTARKYAGLVLIVSIALLGTGCNTKGSSAATEEVQLQAKLVEAVPIQLQRLGQVSELSGTLAPIEETTVSFEISGQINSLPFEEGDTVKKGEVLASLDATDYSLQLALANADVHGAGANLAKVKNGARLQEIQQAKVVVEAKSITLAKVQKDYQRMEQLYKNGAISQTEFEDVKNAVELAEKDVAAAEEAYALVASGARTEDVGQTQASYQGAVVTREQAASTLAKAQLKAPIAGTILSKLTDVGQLASPGTPVYRIGTITQLKTILPVLDSQIGSWKVGDAVELTLYESGRTGQVTKIYPSTNEQTGTISVEVVLNNTKQDWFAGQVVSAVHSMAKAEGIFVRSESVFSRGSEPFVFLYKEGKAVKTPVSLGKFIDNQFEITAGLHVGDQLILKGADRLLDGDAVSLKGGNQHD
ncbi:efflux RND transporter periplasmic adaptor subunit [Brevibacillus reuszeri]|uniref:efflux RND transporter periplasmic adaptor subunit n=1 Tax=Brevibacillus reuszeri TaxID=54915 RepID=UPI000CCBEE1B|nr:efflux RND transporter periplasmic adaptor subunit [Brevibacillus reuszeri]